MWREFVKELLEDHGDELTAWEVDFCEGFRQRGWDTPTPKQRTVFERIADKLDLQLPEAE